MGTRADFYVGEGEAAQWLGSVTWDGYEWLLESGDDDLVCVDPESGIGKARNQAVFRDAVQALLDGREDATYPREGWPWPWNTSSTTDVTYWFADGKAHGEFFSKRNWPNMSARRNDDLIMKRSGLIVVSVRGD